MNVKDLKKMLEKYPDDMVFLVGRYSDYDIVKEEDFEVVKAVDKGDYVMRSHPTMSDENKAKEKDYLYLWGN